MKSKKLRIVVLLFVALMVGWVIWQFFHTPEYVATANVHVYSTTTTVGPKTAMPVAPAAQVEMPKAAAVGANGGEVTTPAEAAALAQAELKATVKDMASTMRDKGWFSWSMAFYPPEFKANKLQREPEFVQLMLKREADDKQNPNMQLVNEINAQKYDYLATLTPTLNAAGDKATYFGNPPSEDAKPGDPPKKIAILIKIDGKWYWQADWSGE